MRLLVLLLALTGCPAFWAMAPRIAQGASYLGSLLDVAAQGAALYGARHPSEERDEQVALALRAARAAVAALHAASLAGDEAGARAARDAALDAYEVLYAVLDGCGILHADPPPGGAEAESRPDPAPLALPGVVEVGRAMGVEP